MPTFDTNIANQYKTELLAYDAKAKDHSITATEANAARAIAANYYSYLDSVGIKYGAAAYDVSQNIGYFGGVANVLLGNGIAAAKPSFNSAQTDLYRDSIMISLAFQDASLRTNSTIAPNGVLPYLDIHTYHVAKFNEYGIPLSYWGGYGLDKFDYVGSYMGLSGNDSSYNYADQQISYSNLMRAALSNEVTADGVSARDVFYNLVQADQEYKLINTNLNIGSAVAYFEFVATVNSVFLPAPTSTTNYFSIANSVGSGAGGYLDLSLTTDYLDGLAVKGNNWQINLPGSILNTDGLFNVAPSSFLTDGWRPGAGELTTYDLSGNLYGNAAWNSAGNNFYTDTLGGFNSFVASSLGNLNNLLMNSTSLLNIDPLVLDLTGAGIQLNNYNDANVLFNMDADEYKEQTGWIKNGTGFLVMDKNGDGVINDVSEIFSEYFTTGAKNGLAALATFDSNKDGVFNASDSAYTQVRVWQDSNGNGQTDASELSTLASLGITSISLASTAGNGALINGNEVQATSTMVRNGVTRAVAAVNFLTNPNGHEWDLAAQGVIIHSEAGTSSFSISDMAGATANTATLGVSSIYGNAGNDTLIGDGNTNWLGGGGGSDTLSGGAGDDVLIIDAEDLQANIDGGAGFDIVQVVGDSGVNFNLSQAHVELAYGGIGNDILVGGGTASVFIAGGAGEDIIIGSGANDALSGNDGNDMLDGGYGDDVLRGGRGDDLIIGGFGNDIIDGGLGNDVLQGGDGNDVFIASGGSDTVDGGVGNDTVELSGEFSEYTRTTLSDGSIVMTDKVAGRDGAVTVKNIEFFNFSNIGNIGVNWDNPMPADDVVTISASGAQTILASTLFANDVDYQNNPLHITALSDIVGGTAVLNGSGNVVFTPTAGFNGVMSFSYKIADSLGNTGLTAIQAGTNLSAEMKGNVTLTTANLPTDPLFADEWYLKDANVVPVWKDYTGKGVTIGVFEDDIFDYNHPDLIPNLSTNHPNSIYTADDVGSHATLVAGVIGAARNGQGGIGVAYDAKLASQEFHLDEDSTEINKLENFIHYDIVNNSWELTPAFAANFAVIPQNQDVLKNAVTYGRDGLGTILVFGGGNGRSGGGDANVSDFNSSRFGIEVGAVNQQGDIGSLISTLTPFSNPGSSILVSAPGSNVVSTSRLLQNQDGTNFGGSYETASGTSFATPVVSGIVALMLQANPNLGYRDVQKILAYSAKSINDPNTAWQINGATDWNGGGLHVSQDYGFGEVDALAAVRLAETWNTTQTSANEVSSIKQSGTLHLSIPDGSSSLTNSLTVSDSLQVEHVEVKLSLNHAQLGDLIITLIAPDGTKSVLLNRLDKDIGSTDVADRGYGSINAPLLLNSTHDFGQNSVGTWQLKIEDKAGNQVGTLENWELHLYGQGASVDNTYIYTNEFATASGVARQTLNDSTGIDTINASAVTAASVIDLIAGHTSTIAGRSITISSTTTIENLYTGDGNDNITGNSANNYLSGGRGNDVISSGAGNDIIDGGTGNDIMEGGVGADTFIIRKESNASDTIFDFHPATENDVISLQGFDYNYRFSNLIITQSGSNTIVTLQNGQIITLNNVTASTLTASSFNFGNERLGTSGSEVINGTSGNDIIKGLGGSDVINGDLGNDTIIISSASVVNAGDGNDLIKGSANNDIIHGNNHDDSIYGNAGDDTITGDDGIDKIYGGDGSDNIDGGLGNDIIYGGNGLVNDTNSTINNETLESDIIHGGAGDDTLHGTGGNDSLYGDDGNDTIFAGNGGDIIDGGAGIDTIYGGIGSDNIVGGAGDDIIHGEFGVTDTVGGNDIIHGNDGDDIIAGGYGNDTIYGDAGDNSINGGSGDDTIYGGNGTQIDIWGGIGSDRFVIDARYSANLDVIWDFNTSDQNERIDLSKFGVTASDWGTRIFYASNVQYSAPDSNGVTQIFNATEIFIRNTPGTVTLPADLTNPNVQQILLINVDIAQLMGYHFSYSAYEVRTLFGTDGDGYIFASAADNIIYGIGGNDNLNGNNGRDQIYGGAGDDVLAGGYGSDVLDGGTGNNTASYTDTQNLTGSSNPLGVNVNLQTGINIGGTAEGDTLINIQNITGSNFADTLTGDANSNIISGLDGNDTINGGAGNDTLNGGLGSDAVNGGDGDDTINGSGGADTIDGGIGMDTASYSSSTAAVNVNLALATAQSGGDAEGDKLTGIENVIGSAFNDNLIALITGSTLDGGAGDDKLYGGAGNDTLIGGAGADTIDGGDGIDTVSYESSSLVVNVDLAIRTSQQWGASGDTIINVENLIGSAFGDRLSAATAGSTIHGGEGNDTIYGVAGNDFLYGDNGNDTFYAGDGNDIIYGGLGDDTIYSQGGNNILIGGAGADTFNGFSGVATATYVDSSSGVNIDLSTNINSGGDAQGDKISGAPNIIGSNFDDILIGDGFANSLFGGNGNDLLAGRGYGGNHMDGGDGIDTVTYESSSLVVNIDLAIPTSQQWGASGDTIVNVENLIGSAFGDTLSAATAGSTIHGGDGNDTISGAAGNDVLYGDAGNDLFYGKDGNDIIYGGLGDDVIYGQGGNNILIGGAGIDTLYGFTGVSAASYSTSAAAVNINMTTNVNSGGDAAGDLLYGVYDLIGSILNDSLAGDYKDNSITGGTGADTLTGGSGADVFKYTATTDSGAAAGVRDIIVDFTNGTDKVDLSAFTGDFVFKGTGAFTGTAHEVNYAQVGGNTILGMDADGNGSLDFQIELTGLHTMTSSDFLL